MENDNKNKRDYLLYLLEEGDAMVCLDARLPDVLVPKVHKINASLNLIFNLNFKRPLDIEEDGIYSTLSFNGRKHKCVIPFEAVWAIYDPKTQKGQVWEEAIPQDINLEEKIMGKSKAAPGPKRPAVLVKQGGKPSTAETRRPAPAKRDRSHLRVIK